MTPEGKVKAAVKRILEKAGCWYFMPATGGYGKSGVPDFIGCIDGALFGIECKAGDNQPTALQKAQIENIQRHGGAACVVNETTIRFLPEWLQTVRRLSGTSWQKEGAATAPSTITPI